MPDTATPTDALPSAAVDPVSRISEILFGLIMVLTFTGSLRAVDIGREDVREMLIGALGCNLAWGIIDAFFFLITSAAERGRGIALLRKVQSAPQDTVSDTVILDSLPEPLSRGLSKATLDGIRKDLRALPLTSTDQILLSLSDLRGAFHVFALVFLSTFPPVIPFLVMHDPSRALRVSNLIAVILLFCLGYSLGKFAERAPILNGILMAIVGVVLVGITIALGG